MLEMSWFRSRSKTIDREFTRLYQAHLDQIYRFFYLELGHHQAAEDLTAATFETAYQKFNRYTEQGKALPWLFTIAGYQLKKHWRRERLWKRYAPLLESQTQVDDSYQDQRYLCKLLKLVTETERQVLILRYVEDLAIEDIATMTGLSPNNIYVISHRALGKLRAAIEEGAADE